MHIIREAFTTDICRKITWAILTDGRSFFNRVLVHDLFLWTEPFGWPTSLIGRIADDVRYAKEIVRPSYPMEWVVQLPVGAVNNRGGIMGSGGSGNGDATRAGAKRGNVAGQEAGG